MLVSEIRYNRGLVSRKVNFTATSLALLLALVVASCAVPLGPRFYRHRELVEVRYVPAPDARVEVHSTMEIENSGNRPLEFVDVALPGKQSFARSDAEIDFGGYVIEIEELPHKSTGNAPAQNLLRLRLASPWPLQAKSTLRISYTLRASLDSATGAGVGTESFFLDENWFPMLLAPEGLFAKGEARQKKCELRVSVPHGYKVHASGKLRGSKSRGAEREFRFQVEEDDFLPFVVGGDYLEHRFQGKDQTFLFWTREAIPQHALEHTGRRLVVTSQFFQFMFGQLSPRHTPMVVVEMDSSTLDATWVLPGSILLSGSKLRESLRRPPGFLERKLAFAWTERIAQPANAPAASLSDALATLAAVSAREARGDPMDWHRYVSDLMTDFDKSRVTFKEKTIPSLRFEDAEEIKTQADKKTSLMLLALRQEVSPATLHRAIRHMLQSLRGSTYGWVDFRAAVEAESGRDLGEFFRKWLNETGIPEEFRKRYE